MASDRLILGIDLGGTDCKFGLMDANGRLIHTEKHPTQADLGPDGVIDLIAVHSRDISSDKRIIGIGMGVPGPMNSREGIVYEAPNLPGWINVPVKAILEEKTGFPVVLNNDANAAAYGEFWTGAGKGSQNMILFTLGTGVGGGIIINGELYGGPDDTAAELGHMTINFDGPKCGCGSTGCLETYASATAVKKMVLKAVAAGTRTSIRIPNDGEELGALDVYDAAQKGDVFAIEVFRRVGFALGVAAANCVNIFNPDLIVYAGAMAGAGEFIFGPLRETAKARCFEKPGKRVKIKTSKLRGDAGIIGASGLALKAITPPVKARSASK